MKKMIIVLGLAMLSLSASASIQDQNSQSDLEQLVKIKGCGPSKIFAQICKAIIDENNLSIDDVAEGRKTEVEFCLLTSYIKLKSGKLVKGTFDICH